MKSRSNLLGVIALMALFFISTSYPLSAQTGTSGINSAIKHRVYDHLLNPREHPDDDRKYTRAPDWNTFGNRTRFICLRSFQVKDDQIINYVEDIEKWSKTYDLGDVFWPTYHFLLANNLSDLLGELKRRDQFLFDIWNYIPGFGPGEFPHYQFKIPTEVLKLVKSKLGDHWLGMGNDEQDGRYVGSYARLMYRPSASRLEQYFNFQRHFQKLCDEQGNKMCTLVSLNFGHYFLKEGVYTLIGAETAQGLPNGQVYYAFNRGAGKQYGVPWFGNASVFNRWGYKVYGREGPWGRRGYGPTKGTSLNLLKRLMYSQILYNSVCVGFEMSWFDGDKLTPIGRIQQGARRWVKKNGQPGAMLTPIAVMADFFSGWSFPRHLYTQNVYRVWGNLPYEAGDYLTDGVIDMIYPGYQNSSYFHDESGFISPTPYGDAADCILSDAQGWLLERYPVLVVAGELSGGAEIRDKLQSYIEGGGRLFITAGSLAKLPGGIAGVQVDGPPVRFSSGEKVETVKETLVEDYAFEIYPLMLPPDARVIVKCGNKPAAVEIPYGEGVITVFASPFGVCSEPAVKGVIANEVDKPLLKHYPLLKHVRNVLDKAFRSQMLFEVDDELCLITCRKGGGEYTLGILNNSLQEKPLQIVSHCGSIESVRELEIDQSEKGAVGYLPEDFENVDIGKSDEWSIAGGDVRIFVMKVKEENVEQIPHIVPSPRPQNRALPLYSIKSIKEEILSRPTFFEHFDRVVVDWKYLHRRDKNVLEHEAGWISRQKLGLIIDATSGINLYPDLRLVNNLERDYEASVAAIENILVKMEILGAHDLCLSLHPSIYRNFTKEQTYDSFEKTLRMLCRSAEIHNVTIHLRTYYGKPLQNLKEAVEFIERVGAVNLRLAPSTALLLTEEINLPEIKKLIKDKVSLWFISAPAYNNDVLWHANSPIAGYNNKSLLKNILAIAPKAPLVLDGLYKNKDEEYIDARALDSITP